LLNSFVKISIRFSRKKLFQLMLVYALGLIISICLARFDGFIFKLAWLGVILFGIMMFNLISCFLTDPVVISDDGIEDIRNGFGLIETRDIIEIGKIEFGNKYRLYVVVNDFEKYKSRLSQDERASAEQNERLGFSPIMIRFDWLDFTAEHILEQIDALFGPRWNKIKAGP